MNDTILKFTGSARFLSNFWPARVEFEGYTYPTVEHAYVAAKSTDENFRAKIRMTESPSDVKKLGRRILLRSDWKDIKVDVMWDLLLSKFENPELAEKLIRTYPAKIEEGNSWNDRFWGISPVGSGEGKNVLGILLMMLRSILWLEWQNSELVKILDD